VRIKALIFLSMHILDSRTGRGIPKMPVDRLIETRKENGAGNDTETVRSRSRRGRVLQAMDDDVVGGQQKQSPEEGIPEGGPIPLHRDTTISIHVYTYLYSHIYIHTYIDVL